MPSSRTPAPLWFTGSVTLWLWFTVVFANFAEAVAEGRGKAQADTLRKMRTETIRPQTGRRARDGSPCLRLRKGDHVVVEAGQMIPGDGEVIEGIASVDESAITGESAPVIRESGGDRSAVTGGTQGPVRPDRRADHVESRRIVPRSHDLAGRRGLAAKDAERNRPAHFAGRADAGVPVRLRHARAAGACTRGIRLSATVMVALLVCLIPTTIGGLLSAIGIAGMDRLIRKNVLAMSGRAIEAAGDVDVLLLDKTGTITIGNRMATRLAAAATACAVEELAQAAYLASQADETPEGRSIVTLIRERHPQQCARRRSRQTQVHSVQRPTPG